MKLFNNKIISVRNQGRFKTVHFLGIRMRFSTKEALQEHHINQIRRKLGMIDNIWQNNGVLFFVPNYPLDYIQSHIVDNGDFYERKELERIRKYIPTNAVILDIGANIGNHSLFWASQGMAKKIYSFEPIKATFNILEKNIFINHFENIIEAKNIGISNKKSKAKIISYSMANIGGTSLTQSDDGNIQLDFLDNMQFKEHIDFIKIDTEGHELLVLEGAKKTLQKHKPTVFIETFGENFFEVKKYFDNLDYELKETLDAGNFVFSKKM